MNVSAADLVIIVICLIVMHYAGQALRILTRDGWRHFRKHPHAHASCSICARWAKSGVDVQNHGKPMPRAEKL